MKTRSALFVVLVLGLAVSAQASSIVYDVNAAMLASESSAHPSATFGQWAIQWADPGDVTTATVALGDSTSVSGWGGGNTASDAYIYINRTGAQYNNGTIDLGPTEMGFHSSSNRSSILTWTAPSAGTINIAATYRNLYASTTSLFTTGSVYVLTPNGTGGYSQLFYSYLSAGNTAANVNLTGVAVTANQKILFDVGHLGTDFDAVGFTGAITFSAVPEPSSIAIVGSALIGLLAYAWRKRR